MEKTIVRDVRDITGPDRDVLEQALGQKLRDNQRLVVQILTVTDAPEAQERVAAPAADLPEWCDVFRGLSDEQIAGVERTTWQRLDLTRPSA
jgi:hypothetical protein